MKVGDNETDMLVDLIRSSNTSREKALALLDSICRTAHSEGVVAGSKSTGDLINKTFDAMMGARPCARS